MCDCKIKILQEKGIRFEFKTLVRDCFDNGKKIWLFVKDAVIRITQALKETILQKQNVVVMPKIISFIVNIAVGYNIA